MTLTTSVLIPVFNGGRYLGETIRSVLDQTFQNFEIIVLDDGSTDDTARVAAEFSPRVQYYFQTNQGIGAARNRLVELATGDFLAFIDADDCWTADKLSLQMAELNDHSELDAVFGMVRQTPNVFWEKAISEISPPLEKLIAGLGPGTMLIRRASFARVGFFPTEVKVGEFIDWYLRAQEVNLK